MEATQAEVELLNTLQLKERVADAVLDTFRPVRARLAHLDDAQLDRLLAHNAERARRTARDTLAQFKELAGYDQPRL